MSMQHSFTRIENDLLPAFRLNLGLAESTEDVRKFFSYAMTDLLSKVFEGRFPAAYEDLTLAPAEDKGFAASARLQAFPEFEAMWTASDLSAIIGRFAGVAVNRYRHLEKNPDKTESKMYPTPDRVGQGKQP
ncbi:hypothetical protein [Desulfolutivibrio sp.]|uniref:hypothetical protein n=1 Tax=Desulfolutivibrio sp. TaxID=2773296 RepID=UPI002F961D4E